MTHEPNLSGEPPQEDDQEIIYAAKVEAEVEEARAECKPEWVKWADLYVGPCRSNASEACRVMGAKPRTGRAWLAHPKIRRYMQAVIKRESMRVMVTSRAIIQELGFIGMADPTELFELVPVEQERAAQDGASRGVSSDLKADLAALRALQDTRGISHVPMLRNITDLPRRLARSIKSIKVDALGRPTEITFHDKTKALQLLGQAYQLFSERPPEGGEAAAWTGFKIIAPEGKEITDG